MRRLSNMRVIKSVRGGEQKIFASRQTVSIKNWAAAPNSPNDRLSAKKLTRSWLSICNSRSKKFKNLRHKNLTCATTMAIILKLSPVMTHTTFRVKPPGDVKVVDPTIASDSIARNFGYMIYDTYLQCMRRLALKRRWLSGGPRAVTVSYGLFIQGKVSTLVMVRL